MASRIPSSHPSFSFCSPFHPPWREGILVLQRWRRGSLLVSASLLPTSQWRWSQPQEEGGGGVAEVAVAVGGEGDEVARQPCLRQRCLP